MIPYARDCVPALAKATFFEALRDRVLLVVVLFGVGLLLFSRVLGWLSVEDELKMVQDYSLSGIALLGLFLAMLVGAFSLAKEVERRTACTVLTRDLGRGEFILAKYLGLVGVFWCCLVGSFALLLIWKLIWGGAPNAAMFAALAGLMLESMVLTAVALFLGALTHAIIAAIGVGAFYLAGHSTEVLREMTGAGTSTDFAPMLQVLYFVLPNLEDVNFLNATHSSAPVAWGSLGLGALSVLCWTVAFLLGAAALFRKREL